MLSKYQLWAEAVREAGGGCVLMEFEQIEIRESSYTPPIPDEWLTQVIPFPGSSEADPSQNGTRCLDVGTSPLVSPPSPVEGGSPDRPRRVSPLPSVGSPTHLLPSGSGVSQEIWVNRKVDLNLPREGA